MLNQACPCLAGQMVLRNAICDYSELVNVCLHCRISECYNAIENNGFKYIKYDT